MPVLKNAKHEKFANALASGVSATDAYISAGYSEQGAAVSASRLLRDAKVRERVDELKSAVTQKIVEETGLTKAWVMENLKEIVERTMQVRAVVKNGRQLKTVIELPLPVPTPAADAKSGDTAGAAANPDGGLSVVLGVFQFQPKAATEALELIGKELGMFVNRHAGANGEPLAPPTIDFSQYSDEELTALNALLKKAHKKAA